MPDSRDEAIEWARERQARRSAPELETAIALWFHETDPVSIHALTGAAYKLLYDINTKAGGAVPTVNTCPVVH